MTWPINLGNLECTAAEVANRVVDLANSESMIAFRQLPADDPIKLTLDIAQAQRPVVGRRSVETDLAGTLSYFDGLLHRKNLVRNKRMCNLSGPVKRSTKTARLRRKERSPPGLVLRTPNAPIWRARRLESIERPSTCLA